MRIISEHEKADDSHRKNAIFFVLHKIIIAVLMELYRHYAIIIAEMHKEYCAFLLVAPLVGAWIEIQRQLFADGEKEGSLLL